MQSYPSRMFEVFKLTGTGTGGGRFCDDSPTSSECAMTQPSPH